VPEVRVQVVKSPTVISTFAGCGGSSLGYKLAGFRELLAVEWDDNAVETFRLNFPGVPVFHGDIAKLTGAECMRLAGIGPGELDVFDGSPPCQGFSTAGKRRFDDPRNSLFREYARLLKELQPRVFVMENVTGMIKGCMKQAYLTIIAELRACGYRTRGEVLNAMYFNVPQSRERVIIIGVRNDLGIEPTHPKPQTWPVTVREAFAGLTGSEPDADISRFAIGKEWARLGPGKKSAKYLNLVRAAWDKPSPTITKGVGKTRSLASVTHPTECRKYSIAEARRVASFPDEFGFAGTWGESLERIGNSVPPNLMRAIAEHIRTEILDKATE
jgi:DNA (cytosine-5)-methyltransferase 1